MLLRFNWKKLVVSLLIPLAVGGLSALITGSSMDIYKTIERPPFSPPSIVFHIVWTVLYILMGVSLYFVWNSPKSSEKQPAYWLFALQLALNFAWSPIFFIGKQFLLSFFVLILLWVTVLLMIFAFCRISKPAGYLQIPYLIWLTIAGYLNIGVYILNK